VSERSLLKEVLGGWQVQKFELKQIDIMHILYYNI